MIAAPAGFSADRFRAGLVAETLEMGNATFEVRIIQIGNPGLDCLIEAGKALTSLAGPPMAFE